MPRTESLKLSRVVFVLRVATRAQNRPVVGGRPDGRLGSRGGDLRGENVAEHRRGRTRDGETSRPGKHRGEPVLILTILRRSGGLADRTIEACLCEITGDCLHFSLLFLLLEIKKFQIGLKTSSLLSHVLNLLAFLLELQ